MEQRAFIEMIETNTNFQIKKNKMKVQKKATNRRYRNESRFYAVLASMKE